MRQRPLFSEIAGGESNPYHKLDGLIDPAVAKTRRAKIEEAFGNLPGRRLGDEDE